MWDTMDDDAPIPHFSLPHRMRLGWISPDWIEVCDFGKNPAQYCRRPARPGYAANEAA